MERWRSQTNLINAMFGFLILVSPWLLGFAGTAAWNAWLSGAALVAVSMTAIAYFAEWEEWAGMAFPESGRYVVPGALDLVEIDRERNIGAYEETNLWMRHL